MYDDTFIDIVRKSAYPIDASEGPEYERARVRQCLEAIAGFKKGDGSSPRAWLAARDEAAVVVLACFEAVFGGRVDRGAVCSPP